MITIRKTTNKITKFFMNKNEIKRFSNFQQLTYHYLS